jgi:hypothetical protein
MAQTPEQRKAWSHRTLCACGRPKDYRARRCAVCARSSYAVTGESLAPLEEMCKAVAFSCSLQGAADSLGVSRQVVTRFVQQYALSTSHMRWGRGRFTPDAEVFCFSKKRRNGTVAARLRLVNPEGYVCAECGQGPEWNGKPLTLQLHHKNGNSLDNRRHNLDWLCPNCHTQSATFTGRNVNYGKGSE